MRSNRGHLRAPASASGHSQQPTEVVDYSLQQGGDLPTLRVSPANPLPRAVGRARGIGMGYAKYVGRVGALAFALGLGAAVATSTPGIALAEEPEPNPDPGTNQPNEPQPDPAPNNPNPNPDPAPPPAGETPP